LSGRFCKPPPELLGQRDEIGVTNRTCTGTNAVTGHYAAVTS
jgi:hypothetical protein